MSSILRLTFVILIFNYKLHGLNAAALNERYKKPISDISSNTSSSRSSSNTKNTTDKNYYLPFDDSSFNEVYNKNNNEIVIGNTTLSATRIKTLAINTNTTSDWQINNKYLLRPLANSSRSEDFVAIATGDKSKTPLKQIKQAITQCDNDGKDSGSNKNCDDDNNSRNNHTNLRKSERKIVSKSSSNLNMIFEDNQTNNGQYNREDENDNKTAASYFFISSVQQLVEPTTNNNDSHNMLELNIEEAQLKTEEAEIYYKYNVTQNDNNQTLGVEISKDLDNGNPIDTTTAPNVIVTPDKSLAESKDNDKSDTLLQQSDLLDLDVWDTKGIFNELGNLANPRELRQILDRYKRDLNTSCIMDGIKSVSIWWSNKNGTLNSRAFSKTNAELTVGSQYLDLSYRSVSDDNKFYKTLKKQIRIDSNIVVFSAAHNNLTKIPYLILTAMNETLQFLTLKGNNFSTLEASNRNSVFAYINRLNGTEIHNEINGTTEAHEMLQLFTYQHFVEVVKSEIIRRSEGDIAWATFPKIPKLIELDISECNIENIERDVFQNITGLRKLFLSRNKMIFIPQNSFVLLPDLEYLDLSFTNLFQFDYQFSSSPLDNIWNLIYGVKIHAGAFKNLTKLIYLDLSHTMITRNSALALTQLGQSLKYMSLCFTSFPMIGKSFFKNTGLVGLDLTGNTYAAYNFVDDAFEGIADSLKYLFFEQSNVKQLKWMKPLKNLIILSLAGNNVNELSVKDFSTLKKLRILDLSSNNIGNWYRKVFANNTDLSVIKLHNNNINMINNEMLSDLSEFEYLSLGENNFICDCLLQDLVSLAVFNTRSAVCTGTSADLLKGSPNLLSDFNVNVTDNVKPFEELIPGILLAHYSMNSKQNYINLHKYKISNRLPRSRLLASALGLNFQQVDNCTIIAPTYSNERLNESGPKFQLLDYDKDTYWCFNDTNRMQFMQLNCQASTFGAIEENLNMLTRIVVSCTCSFVVVTILIVIIYLKRWHIYYYYSSLKSAALMSVATKDKVKKLNELTESDPNLVYDIFISYCQSDRDWVLTELLPNVEDAGNVSICLHERDFQIGVAILENIISCMDRSRALMLIISSNFLLSHWCQFEMHLAQHRIFEASKEHLIIVFLEDIPRNKRPKTLQYLMEVKTYIKWPGAKGGEIKPEDRKYFWKRFRRSLEQIGISAIESQA